MVKLFQGWGYKAWWEVLNTKDHGIPQSRPRFYFVAILKKSYTHKFHFPETIDAEPLAAYLDKGDTVDYQPHDPLGGFMMKDPHKVAMERGMERLRSKGVDPMMEDCVIDVGSTAKWQTVMANCSPCLTAARCRTGGHYLTSKRRLMTIREMARLQGTPPHRFAGKELHPTDLAKALGNAMSVNVLTRLFAAALYAAGLVSKKLKVPELFSKVLHDDDDDP